MLHAEKDDLRHLKIILTLFGFLTGSTVCGQTDSTDCVSKIDTVIGKQIYTFVDKMPQPEGGQESLFKKLIQEIEVGPISKDEPIGSMTVVSFVVSETGEIINKKVEREDFKGRNIPEQMFSVIESINWIQGSCNGHFVPVEYRLPFRICLR